MHNSALNHMYYNPRLTYDPPVYSDASSYPQMDSGNTSAWTKVRADPFTTPDPLDCSSEPCVDLTANVIVGQWCNSDWTQGNDDSGVPFVTNPGHCRVNGLIAAASAGAPAAIGDYMYPWAPTGITPNDYTTKVDMSTISTVAPLKNATVKGAWAGAGHQVFLRKRQRALVRHHEPRVARYDVESTDPNVRPVRAGTDLQRLSRPGNLFGNGVGHLHRLHRRDLQYRQRKLRRLYGGGLQYRQWRLRRCRGGSVQHG